MAMTKEQEQALALAEAELKLRQKPMTAGEVATGAIVNFPSSFKNLIGNIVEAITNPGQTAKSVWDVGAGALQNVLPEKFVQAVGEDKQSRDMARAVGQFYADRYGTGENLKRAIAEDPAGVLADLSTVLTGGAGLTRTGADIAAITSRGAITAPRAVSEYLGRAASAVDPLSLAARGVKATATGVGKVAAPVLGMQTGVGAEPIRQAVRAGREGGETSAAFRANISGETAMTDVLDAAKANLDALRTERSNQYRSGMTNISQDKTVLSFDGIDSALKQAEGRTKFKGQIKDQSAFNALTEAKTLVDDWKKLDPADYHTPEGFDALKQSIGAVLEKFDPKTNSFNTINQVYNSIKSEITKQAPVYANTMKEYTQASEQIREVERALSLGNKASADTAMRKLQSLMRDNVQTNYGQRVQLARELEKAGGRELMPSLAGQALSEFTPRGLQRAAAIPTGGLAYLVGGPIAAGTSLATSSPRFVGEAAYLSGLIGRGAEEVSRRLPFAVNPQLYNLLYQSGQMQGLLGE
jgi:hypothetical protein